jgi:heme/copper-type cytochrome/quinol oxidase subunit 1
VYDYSGPAELWNVLVTVGHGLMGVVLLAFLALAAKALRAGESAAEDPWEAHTLVWSTASPAPVDNFIEVPTVMSPEPRLDMRAAPEAPDGRASASEPDVDGARGRSPREETAPPGSDR